MFPRSQNRDLGHPALNIFPFVPCPFVLLLAGLVADHGQRLLIGIAGIGVGDLGLGLGELGLGKIDDAAQSDFVARLGELKGGVGFVQELPGDGDLLEGDLGVEDGGAHVAGDVVAQVAHLLRP